MNCGECVKAYDGHDNVLRCRLTGKPAEIPCLKFEREPGSDSEESSRVWFAGAWCSEQGRGD